MVLFLEGDRRVGKSTLLRELLSPHTSRLAGCAVQRLFLDGKQQGFRAVSLAQEYPTPCGEWIPELAGVFIQNGRTDLSKLAQVLSKVLLDAQRAECRMILLDEIGGIELSDPAIMQTLHCIFSLGKPCIGVLKSAGNLRHIAASAGLDVSHTVALRTALAAQLTRNGQVVSIRQDNLDAVRAQMQAFLAQHLDADQNIRF